jgi:hypothetical protein
VGQGPNEEGIATLPIHILLLILFFRDELRPNEEGIATTFKKCAAGVQTVRL